MTPQTLRPAASFHAIHGCRHPATLRAGRHRLDAPGRRLLLPDVPFADLRLAAVTIRQLFANTSGLTTDQRRGGL